MKFKLDIDYKRKAEQSKETSNAELTADYVNFAITNTHKDGIEGQLKRIVGRLQRKIDEAVEKGQKSVELEQAEIDLIKKSFEKVKVPANIVKYWMLLEDELDKLDKEDKK